MEHLQALVAYIVTILVIMSLITSPFWLIFPKRKPKSKPFVRSEPLNKWVTMVDWDGPSLVEVTAEPNETFTLRRIGRDNLPKDGIENQYDGLSGKELAEMSI